MWKMKMHYRIMALLSAVFILLIACGLGSAWTETRITTNPSNSENPSIWANYIVWQDTRNGGNDIYLQNLATKVQTRVTKGVDAAYPMVSGNKIVWQDRRNGNWDIYMYEISSKKTTRITTNTADQIKPAVYGNLIVWDDYRNGIHDVYLQDLTSKVQTRITVDKNTHDPAIYGTKIVYEDEAEDGICMYDIKTKKTTLINAGGSTYPNIYSTKIVCQNDYEPPQSTILTDYVSGKFYNVPNGRVEHPAIYSNKIVYDDYRNGNWDIYMTTF